MMNLHLSQAVAYRIGALPNCCHRNAMLAYLSLPQCAQWRYVEGWAITHEWPIEHGWLCAPNREIIDPTLALFDQHYIHTRYFPGNAFTEADITYCYSVEQLLSARHVTPLSYRIRWASSEHEAARLRAYASR